MRVPVPTASGWGSVKQDYVHREGIKTKEYLRISYRIIGPPSHA
jgi:hypothetical protein